MPSYEPTRSELLSFADGMYRAYELCKGENPDAVIFPLRGAFPFSVSFKKIAELNQDAPQHFLLSPLGTCLDYEKKIQRGVTKSERYDVVRSGLESHLAQGHDAGKIMLVDEVRQGGAIIKNYIVIRKLMQEIMPEAELQVCAIESAKKSEQLPRYLSRAVRFGFYRVLVDNLFVMDRTQYLPTIVKRNGKFQTEDDDESKLETIIEEIERMH